MAEDVSNDSSYNAASRNPHSEHELLLYELETSDTSSVGLVVRAIYEGDEYEKFMERLDARIKNHDRDIERMCNFHYQGFIDSIRELLQVRTKAQKLKSKVSWVFFCFAGANLAKQTLLFLLVFHLFLMYYGKDVTIMKIMRLVLKIWRSGMDIKLFMIDHWTTKTFWGDCLYLDLRSRY
ncbi:UNVERIFIED_CONTAM: Exocyst complex component 6B [Trichonephila clavipes]